MNDWLVPLSDVRFTAGEVEAVAEVYRSGWLSQGPRVATFERDFAAFSGSGHALATSSATAALHLSLVAGGVGAGDEVIVPSLTFAATASTVVAAGARPVFADVRALDRPWLAADSVEAAIGPRTRAIVTVSYGGHPGEAGQLRALADARGLLLVEDAAHAVGAELAGRAAGTYGHAGAFSFFANKNLHLGEGGMLVTDDARLYERARLLRSHGLTADTWARHRAGDADYDVLVPGFNYRLDEPRAALGRLLLTRLPADNRRRAHLAAAYASALMKTPDVAPAIAARDPAVRCAWHIYPVLLAAALSRRDFRRRLRDAGVQTSIHYPPLHLTSAFAAEPAPALPLTEEYGRRTVTLPLFAHMTEDQQRRVVAAVQIAGHS
jgi:dTDP-4-amino-4,6-dideoxygalactose transaminase